MSGSYQNRSLLAGLLMSPSSLKQVFVGRRPVCSGFGRGPLLVVLTLFEFKQSLDVGEIYIS